MKLFVLVDGLGIGGAEKSLLAILSRLHSTETVVCAMFAPLDLAPAFATAGAKVVGLDLPGRRPTWKGWRRLLRLLRQEQPDLLHVSGTYAGLLGRGAGRWLGIPVVDSFINESYTRAHYASLPWRSRLNLRVLHIVERVTSRWVDRVIANSETVCQTNSASLGIPLHKISVLYRGRDPEPFLSPDPVRLANLIATLPEAEARPRLVNVARLIPRKGQLALVHAMPAILDRYPAATLYLAGDGHFRRSLDCTIAAAGLERRVHLLGTVEAIPELLALGDLFVFASHFEGLPGAVIEAMLAGKAIVAADTPVHRELLRHGQSGWLVASDAPAAWAAGIVYALDHPDEACAWGRTAQADALERFAIDTIAARYETFYQSVVTRWKTQCV